MSKGVHLIVDCHGVPRNTCIDAEGMIEAMIETLVELGFTPIHQFTANRRSVEGFVATAVLDESHMTCHTHVADATMAIDIFTCGDKSPRPVLDALRERVRLGTIATRQLTRFQGVIP